MSTDDDIRINFGRKWRGYRLSEVDWDYLIWMRDQTDFDVTKPRLYQAVINEIWRRTRFRQAKPQARPQPPALDFKAILANWRREAARRWHPDAGGDTRVMAAINSEHEQLQHLFERALSA